MNCMDGITLPSEIVQFSWADSQNKMENYVISLLSVLVIMSMPIATESLRVKRGANCYLSGRVYHDGEIFTIPGSSGCVQYQCIDGIQTPIKEGCYYNGSCLALEQLFIDNCYIKQCKKTLRNNNYMYNGAVIIPGCKDYLGVCHVNDDPYADEQNGIVYARCRCHTSGSYAETYCD